MSGRKARKFPRIFKSLNHLFKKCQYRQEERLVSHMCSEPAEDDPVQQSGCLTNTTDQIEVDPEMYTQESILPNILDSLPGNKYTQELKNAAEQVKQCDNKGSGSYSQCRLKDYLTAVERFVENNSPVLPTNSQPCTGADLNDAMNLMCSKVTSLVPVLDSELVNYLIDSYNRHLIDMLYILMDRSSVKDAFFLLQWVKNTYFSQDYKGYPITQNNVLRILDPLLLAHWLTYSQQKLLKLLQDDISTTLHNILQHDECHGVYDDSHEEALIQVQLDVIQYLNAFIQASTTISHTLKNAVKRLCCDELHSFIQRYMNAKRANEANLLGHFSTIYTCRQLRSYALSISDSNNDTDSSTLLMLEKVEVQALSCVQQSFRNTAKDHLKKYFHKEDEHLHTMMVIINDMLATLPQMEQAKETKQIVVKAAYESVTRVYLQCLLQRKYKKLEKRWKDVEKKIMWDGEHFHSNFPQQNESDDQQKLILLKMGEILQCRNVDAAKLLCSKLYITFPEESKEYIPALLHWRGEFSRQQIMKVIEVSRAAEDHVRNGGHARARSCMHWCCCYK